VPEPVRLEPWDEDDLPLLEQLLGGPESQEKIVERQARYVKAESGLFKIVDQETGEGAGWVGYWDKTWRDQEVYEIGWAVLPAFQGRGIARTATAQAIAAARAEQTRRFVHAFPSVDNAPSNAICRKLGFTLLGEYDFEYPKGSFMRCNDWRLDLFD
jgi:RimJ/RimL family protein N-acetyltransferase